MDRKWTVILVVAALFLAAGTQVVRAGETASQTVTIQVTAINEIAVSPGPVEFTVSGVTAGSSSVEQSDSSSTYAITTNGTGKKITAQIDSDLPSGVELQIQLAPPSGAVSAGAVTLSGVASDVVTGISPVAQSGLAITYTLSVDVTAGPLIEERTVTLTIL